MAFDLHGDAELLQEGNFLQIAEPQVEATALTGILSAEAFAVGATRLLDKVAEAPVRERADEVARVDAADDRATG